MISVSSSQFTAIIPQATAQAPSTGNMTTPMLDSARSHLKAATRRLAGMAVDASRRGRARRARGRAAQPTGFPEGLHCRIPVPFTGRGRLGACEQGASSCRSRSRAPIPIDWLVDDPPTLAGKPLIEPLATERHVPQLEPTVPLTRGLCTCSVQVVP